MGVPAIYRYSLATLIFILKVLVEESGVILEKSRMKQSCGAKMKGQWPSKGCRGVFAAVALVGFRKN